MTLAPFMLLFFLCNGAFVRLLLGWSKWLMIASFGEFENFEELNAQGLKLVVPTKLGLGFKLSYTNGTMLLIWTNFLSPKPGLF